MRIDILTLFPEMVEAVLSASIIGRAREAGLLTVRTWNIRDYSEDKHRRVDDTPYGGGMGMLMAAPPVCACHAAAMADLMPGETCRTIYMSPAGQLFHQKKAAALTVYDRLILLCGYYEGIDQRAIDAVCDEELSVGNYVLTGGELPACIVADAVGRLLPGVLASPECHELESIACGMLEYPQYTRPVEFRGQRVPEILQNGNHRDIEAWRYRMALDKTLAKRPDLL